MQKPQMRCSGWRRLSAALLLAAFGVLAGCAALPPAVPRVPTQALPASDDSELVRIAKASTTDPALSGFRLLSWSEQSFATRIELANRAQRSLDVQYYVLANDDTGHLLLRALRDAAARGVRVRLLLDDLYTGGSDGLLLGLAAHPNVEVRLFNPFPSRQGSLVGRFAASLFDFGRLNHRMHNKLFVADSAMAVAGGRNIGNEYFMAHDGANYIDLDVFVVGAVLPRLGELFDQYWNSEHVYPVQAIVRSDESAAAWQRSFDTTTAPQPGRGPQPPRAGAKDLLDQLSLAEEMRAGKLDLIWAEADAFADSPDKVIDHRRHGVLASESERSNVRQSLMKELLLAREDVLVSSPYMVPDRSVIEDMREGRLWGLPITLITNSLASTDEPLVHAGYRRYRREMLDLGVQVYEVAPSRVRSSKNLGSFGRSIGRFHAKAAAIDGKLMFVGSLNFDPRSEKHNTELGFLIRSPQLTGQLLKLAEVVKTEAAYRVRLDKGTGALEWHITSPEGQQTFFEEPDTGWWQRAILWLVGPLVPEGHL
jgi:cardiolipin synthase C